MNKKVKNYNKTKKISKLTHLNPSSKQKKQSSSTILPQQTQIIENKTQSTNQVVPYSHLIFSKKVKKQCILKHVLGVFIGVNYGVKMRQLTKQQLEKYKFKLPTEKSNKKTLFLDLDETLIHTNLSIGHNFQHKIQIKFNEEFQQITFNLRPFCLSFLQSLSKIYQIYIFTASHDYYAKAIMNFLNSKNKYISGYLSRQFCLRTASGLYIKDLSRISNRNLKQMVIVDNLSSSFGNLIQNGIPILQFTEDETDEELKFLEQYLVEGSKQDDIRQYNKKYLKLREIIGLRQYFEKKR